MSVASKPRPTMFMSPPQPSEGFRWAQAPWGLVLKCEALEAIAPHVFTNRALELREDETEWRAVAEMLGVARDRIRLIRQVHGADVAVVAAGDGDVRTRPEADAIVSDDPTVAIAIRVADCTPVLIGDRAKRVVGAAHAGWRGTVLGAAPAAVRAMAGEFGSEPRDLV